VGIKQTNDSFVDAITGVAMTEERTSKLKRIPLNNSLRTQLRTLVAQMNVNHKDARTRELAVLRMVADGIDKDALAILQGRQGVEANKDVRNAITLALALYNLQHGDAQVRKDAVSVLSTSLQPEARSALVIAEKEDAEKSVREKAQQAIADIDSRIGVFRLTENIFFGLSLGSVLLLSAIGLAITFGVMGVINMAHGELMMIGAYTTWVIQQCFPDQIGYSLLMAVPTAFLVAGLVGVAIERGVIQFLYGRPLETLLATFGLSLILQQAARSIFSPLNRAVSLRL
jgi:urea transport system permease protein